MSTVTINCQMNQWTPSTELQPLPCLPPSFRLNIWDVGGQKTLRAYWRNYYEQTDGMIWVVDSSDLRRLDDCRAELHGLLKEEVSVSSGLSRCSDWNKRSLERHFFRRHCQRDLCSG